jgi:protein KTI12
VNPEDELNSDEIYSALYEVKAPKPNMSTQCVSVTLLSATFD